MELVCPICNGMAVYLLKCPICGKQMENKGPLTDFLDDYSPYLPIEITQLSDGADKNHCMHLFYCEGCHYDKRVPIHYVEM
ncbi:hypothetical protein [Inediibacterium massiliense]|uniref:hypothetical protein n=1 Tax=Inediibacterium massiliense TaxID=1658111 RepID=UPI0006B53D24|nr:hypothetical protein [Inediibacterium massiliense]